MSDRTLVHACVVARLTPQGWRAVLIEGPSGAGKSGLAIRLAAAGWRWVADDYAEVWRSGGALYATAPDRIAGRLEARGLGIIETDRLILSRVSLVVAAIDEPEQLPEPAWRTLAGVALPRLDLDLRAPTAPQVVALAARRLSSAAVLS